MFADDEEKLVAIKVENLINFLVATFRMTLPSSPLNTVSMDEITDKWDYEFGIRHGQYWVTETDIGIFVEKMDKLRHARLEKAS